MSKLCFYEGGRRRGVSLLKEWIMFMPQKIAVTEMELDPGLAWGTVTIHCSIRISTASTPDCPPAIDDTPQQYETAAFIRINGKDFLDDPLVRYADTGERAREQHRALFLELMTIIGTTPNFMEVLKKLKIRGRAQYGIEA